MRRSSSDDNCYHRRWHAGDGYYVMVCTDEPLVVDPGDGGDKKGKVVLAKAARILKTNNNREDGENGNKGAPPKREPCCCKIVRKKDMVAYTRTEYHIVSKLDHPNIIFLYHWEETPTKVYLFMPYYPNGDVGTCLMHGSGLSEALSRAIFRQLMDALAHLHRNNVVHRDVKVENMLVENVPNDDDDIKIRLIDFEFAVKKKCKDEKLYDFPGTLMYAAPEVVLAKPYLGFGADVWAAGVVLYVLLHNEYPFGSSKDAKEVIYREITETTDIRYKETLDDEIIDLIERMLLKHEALRPSAGEVLKSTWIATSPLC